ncbi:MAG TPA: C39 family peptidase [Pseudomonadales bacterium]|nr:C39 family peptidase [Pseudomonadales bacterium]
MKELLVVVPHSGVVIPTEIPAGSLAEGFTAMLRNVDWYTNWLYDFTDMLDNRQLTFPWCSLLLEANRHPEIPDDAVPLVDVYGESLYRPGQEPDFETRVQLSNKYLKTFHHQIETAIAAGAEFLLDGHSTIAERGVADNQIDIMNFQHTHLDDGRQDYSPLVFAETYGEELQRRLPDVKVTVNASEYFDVYGHVCAAHSVNAMSRVGRKVPAIIQETCHNLYMNGDAPDVLAIDRLRRAFAEAIHATLTRVRQLRRPPRVIELNNMRQTFDFDCGVKALQGVLAYYGVEERADTLLEELNADPEHGTSVQNMIAVAERKGFTVASGTNWTLDDIKNYVDQGHPVIVSIQAWADQELTLKQWRENYEDGHYVVVVGYDGPTLYFEDPASFHRTFLREREFVARWHDVEPITGEKLQRLGIVLLGREPAPRHAKPME